MVLLFDAIKILGENTLNKKEVNTLDIIVATTIISSSSASNSGASPPYYP